MNSEFKNIMLNFSDFNSEAEFIPLLSSEEEDQMDSEKIPEHIPILPLRNTVLFPGVVIPITVGREKSIKLIQDANKKDKIIGVIAQKDIDVEDPTKDDLNKVGTVAHVLKVLKMPDESTTVIIQGKSRFTVLEYVQTEPYFKAKVTKIFNDEIDINDKGFGALLSSLKDLSIQIIKHSPNIPSEASFAINKGYTAMIKTAQGLSGILNQ